MLQQLTAYKYQKTDEVHLFLEIKTGEHSRREESKSS